MDATEKPNRIQCRWSTVASAHLVLGDEGELGVHLVRGRVRLQRAQEDGKSMEAAPAWATHARGHTHNEELAEAGTSARTWRVTSTTRQKTWGGRAAGAGAPPPAASPRCSRCPCGRYTTTLPFRGSGATGPAQACQSSRHTAAPGLGWGGGGGGGVAAELVRLCWEQALPGSASSSSSSTVSLRSIPAMAAAGRGGAGRDGRGEREGEREGGRELASD